MVGAEAFGILLAAVRACLDSGDATATSPEATTTRWWVGLHGLATLRANMPYFPWPPLAPQLEDLTTCLVAIGPGHSRESGRTRTRP